MCGIVVGALDGVDEEFVRLLSLCEDDFSEGAGFSDVVLCGEVCVAGLDLGDGGVVWEVEGCVWVHC